MRDPSPAGIHAVRAAIAALVGSLLTFLLASTALGLAAEASAWPSPDRWVAAGTVCLGAVAAAGLTIGCWLLTASALVAIDRPAVWCGRLGARLTPALLRRAVGLTVGAGIGVTVLGGIAVAAETDLGWEVTTTTTQRSNAEDPAMATSDGADDPATPVEPARDEPTPDDQAPDQPARDPIASPQMAPTPPETPATDQGRTEAAAAEGPLDGAGVTVRPGDSLWRIAARHLPAGASDAEIAAAWPLWYEANRTVIGSDPGLIHPGQVLAPPDASVRAQ